MNKVMVLTGAAMVQRGSGCRSLADENNMAGLTRSKPAWVLGFTIAALFFLFSGSRVLSSAEGHVLALAARFVAPVVTRHPVMVVSVEPDTPSETFTALLKRLRSAKAVGLVPPFPRSVAGVKSVVTSSKLVQGAVPRTVSSPSPLLPPEGLLLLKGKGPDAPPYAFIPGILTGLSDTPDRIEWDPVEVSPSDGALLGFEPGSVPIYRAPLVVPVEERWIPGLAFRLASIASKGRIESKKGAALLRNARGTDFAYRIYPRPLARAVRIVSASEVIARGINLRHRVVLVGVVDHRFVEPVVMAGGESVAPVVAEARLTSALLSNALYTVSPWSLWAQLGAFLAVALVLSLLLPRLSMGTGVVFSLLLAFIALTVELGLLSLRANFLPLTAAVLALLAGNLTLILKKRSEVRLAATSHELASANRLLGQSYQAQGQLDGALERYRRCPVDEDMKERLYTLGLDFERRRQFGKAAATFAILVEHARDFRDVAERQQRNRDADGQVLFGKTTAATPTGTLVLSNPGLARPVLGRYELERELGRGAMGAVYLGRDPKIGRTVAIKTMALSEEFEGEGLVAVRERFFREAETAGRLAHPNIVTIYDAGEDQELAYIAMDYLKGESLATYCRADSLLPVNEVMAIAIEVAEALDYAHGRNVVHRDVKPANIMYDREEHSVSVTDFGVACLTDSSKTRSGTVLGSPSYMSPEQVAGRKVDGRSDIFSLGVTLFQLLSGELPFKGDSLANLMYRITNEKPEDIRKLRRGLPSCLARIIHKALQKEPDRRFQRGNDMAAALRRCRGSKEG